MLLSALSLAALALLAGWARPAEVPGRLDLHVLSLFFVLIVAVEFARKSELFAFGVRSVLARVRSARALAAAAVLVTGATAAPAGAFTALLYGVNAGGCGTPIASLANLIGARLYLAGRSSRRRFWRVFAGVSAILLLVALALSLLLVKYSRTFR